MTRVADVMTVQVQVAVPEMTIQAAARLMAEIDAGVLPVVDDGQLQGMLTDRDIAVRAVALGLGPDTPVADVMTPEARYCFADDDLDAALLGMAGLRIRRMPVLARTGELIGILSLSDAAVGGGPGEAGDALASIAEPGGAHSQSDEADPSAAVAPVVEDETAGIRHFTDDEPG